VQSFINNDFPVLSISRGDASEIIERVIALLPTEIACSDKRFGPDNYMCRSLAVVSRQMRDDFETLDWGKDVEFAGIAMDFVELAIKASSKYLMNVSTTDLDRPMILSNIEAREDVALVS